MNMAKGRVLVVDDDKQVYDTISGALGKFGLTVEYAKSGEEAVEICKTEDYDMMFLDIVMPEVSGLAVIDKLNETKRKLPVIIVITAYDAMEMRQQAIDMGATSAIQKPLMADEIEDAVKLHFLDKRDSQAGYQI